MTDLSMFDDRLVAAYRHVSGEHAPSHSEGRSQAERNILSEFHSRVERSMSGGLEPLSGRLAYESKPTRVVDVETIALVTLAGMLSELHDSYGAVDEGPVTGPVYDFEAVRERLAAARRRVSSSRLSM